MRTLLMCIVFCLVYSTCQAEIKMIFEAQVGIYFSYSEKEKQFQNENVEYSKRYEIQMDTSKQICRIAAIGKDEYDSSEFIFHSGSILKQSPDMIILSKNPTFPNPYQEFYFIYPRLGIGFMVIGKANDGSSPPILKGLPPASISTVPLRLIYVSN